MDEWREAIKIEIKRLKMQRMIILSVDSRLSCQGYLNQTDRDAFLCAINIIDRDIMRLQGELVLDDLLSGAIDFENGSIIKRPKPSS